LKRLLLKHLPQKFPPKRLQQNKTIMGKDSIALAPFAGVHKTFGANGELIIKLFPEAPEEINLSEPIFITIDGYSVPFFFKSFEARGNNRALVVFDDMESLSLAEELVGKMICNQQSTIDNQQSAIDNRQLIDYKVEDEGVGDIGIVSKLLDIPGNPCLLVSNGRNEIMIPCQDEFIVNIDHKKKTVATRLPEGLINLNQPT
jgi:16S rRNA processing protein RimM